MIDEVGSGTGCDANALIQRAAPLIVRGVAAEWSLVAAGRRSPHELLALLRDNASDASARVFVAPEETAGRFGYDESMCAFNFERKVEPIRELLDRLLEPVSQDYRYAGSLELNSYFPGLIDALKFPLPDPPTTKLQCIWIGNGSQIPAHFDLMHNLATVISGQRRFILFPPEQVANLYVGPFDFTPAGQPMSVVNFAAPDLARFPKFAEAMLAARVAVLEPGDALYIPPLWWHQVETRDSLGVLVNYWWDLTPDWAESPVNTLMHTLLAVSQVSAPERHAWHALFNHYVFDCPSDAFDHIPEAIRGAVESLDEHKARGLRFALLTALNR